MEGQQPSKRRRTAPRAKHSCTTCRKSKIKCSGQVPCDRCVRLGKAATCELWHRRPGRPSSDVHQPQLLAAPPEGCPFHSDLLERLVSGTAAAQSCVEQYSRMLIMIGLREQSLAAMYAGTRLAMSAGVGLDDLLLSSDGQNQGSVFSETQQEPVQVCSEVGVGAAQWLEELSPQIPSGAHAAVQWVNQLFSAPHPGFDDSFYEVRTVVRGASRFAELRNPLSRCAEDFSDAEVLGTDALPAGLIKQALQEGTTYSKQGETSKASNLTEVVNNEAAKILNPKEFRERLFDSFSKQLNDCAQFDVDEVTAGVLRFKHSISTECLDGQRRKWACIWDARTCMAERGGFAHSTRKLHSFAPRCDRAKRMYAHLTSLIEKAPPTQQHETPVVMAVRKDYLSSGVTHAATGAMRDSLADVLDVYFEFDELLWNDLGGSVAIANA